MTELKKDWEKIAGALAERVLFALNHYKYNGGLIIDHNKGTSQTPLHYFADGLRMAGYEIDENDVNALCMPAAKRRKYFADKRKQQQPRDRVND